MSMFKLIIGLGNPGKQYEKTRHNIGFMLMDRIASDLSAEFETNPKWQSHFAKLSDGSFLMKPQTFMNLSGRSIRQFMAFFKWTPEDILVIYDDVALPLGTLRFREKGSAGGHNGIKSIIEHLGTQEFPRLKIGIGSSEPGNMVGHVLGKFSPDEQDQLDDILTKATAAVKMASTDGIQAAANHFHTKKKKEPKPAAEEAEPETETEAPNNQEPRTKN